MRNLPWLAAVPLLAGLTWRTEAPLQHPRSAHALAATDTDLFVVGGTGGLEGATDDAGRAKPILEVERFDGKSWRTETVLPGEGLNAPAAVVFEGKLWVIGGFGTTSNVPVATVSVYDFAAHAWSEAPPLPAPRGGHAAIVYHGRIHVFGGGNSVSTLSDHCDFDPETRAWRDRAPLSRSKGSPAAVVFEDKLWAIGGRSGMEDFGDVEIFDDATNLWTAGPPIEARGTAGAVVYGGSIWVVGGESQAQSRCLASVLRFDPALRTWAEAISLPTARNYARTALLGDAFFVVGGSTTAGSSHASLGSTLVDSARIVDAGQPVKRKE
jgi:N-acetylneuraminic acid mutarotase